MSDQAPSNQLVAAEASPRAVAALNANLDLIRRTFAKDLNDAELELFVASANRLGLDIISKEIYAVVYNKKSPDPDKRQLVLMTSIDGYRKVAARSGEYGGQEGPFWCGEDGVWTDVWLSTFPPQAAKVGIWRTGFTVPVWGIATMQEYKGDSDFWKNKPALMLAKCAEGLGIRKAFADHLSGTYTQDEMDQAAIEVRGEYVDQDGVIHDRPRAIDAAREQRRTEPPAKPSAEDRERKKREQILGSIRSFGERTAGFDADLMDAIIQDYADGSALAAIDVAKLVEIHNDLQARVKKDKDEFLAYADSIHRQMLTGPVIDVEHRDTTDAEVPA
jgi:phage recombination protein Bet